MITFIYVVVIESLNSNSCSPVSLGFLLSSDSLPFSFLEGVEFGFDFVSLLLHVLDEARVESRVAVVLALIT